MTDTPSAPSTLESLLHADAPPDVYELAVLRGIGAVGPAVPFDHWTAVNDRTAHTLGRGVSSALGFEVQGGGYGDFARYILLTLSMGLPIGRIVGNGPYVPWSEDRPRGPEWTVRKTYLNHVALRTYNTRGKWDFLTRPEYRAGHALLYALHLNPEIRWKWHRRYREAPHHERLLARVCARMPVWARVAWDSAEEQGILAYSDRKCAEPDLPYPPGWLGVELKKHLRVGIATYCTPYIDGYQLLRWNHLLYFEHKIPIGGGDGTRAWAFIEQRRAALEADPAVRDDLDARLASWLPPPGNFRVPVMHGPSSL